MTDDIPYRGELSQMKVALIGATGNAGSRVLAELTNRGHDITAIVRNIERVPERPNVTPRQTDGSKDDLAAATAGHDAIVSAARFVDLDPDVLVPAVKASGVKRYVVVGGAGSLLHPDGSLEVAGMPEAFRGNSLRGGYLLDLLKATTDLDWTFISPPRFFKAGERTAKFRYGTDHMLLTDAGEPTSISYEDMAVAVADEVEKGGHLRQRFHIGY